MERTMTTKNPSFSLRRLVPVTAVAFSVATGFASGLWTAKSFSAPAHAAQPAIAAKVAPAAAETTAAMWPIAPSQVIERMPLYGYNSTGDGNVGFVSP